MKKNNTFNQYGHSFQSKLVASLLKDRPFLEQIQDILEPNYFESEANKWLVKKIKNYFVEYKSLPTMETVKVLMEDVDSDVLKMAIVDDLRNAYKHFEAADLKFTQEKALDFCKNQKLKEAIIQSVEHLERGEYETK